LLTSRHGRHHTPVVWVYLYTQQYQCEWRGHANKQHSYGYTLGTRQTDVYMSTVTTVGDTRPRSRPRSSDITVDIVIGITMETHRSSADGDLETTSCANSAAGSPSPHALTPLPRLLAASTSARNSSRSRFNLARLFWNHVITCAFVNPRSRAVASRSAGRRYFWRANRRSSSRSWCPVNAVRDLRRFLPIPVSGADVVEPTAEVCWHLDRLTAVEALLDPGPADLPRSMHCCRTASIPPVNEIVSI